MTRKRALLVFPDYDTVHGLSDRVKYVLQQTGTLPPSLGKYSPHGAAADRDELLGVFGPGFSTTVMCGEVTERDIMHQLRLLLGRETSVAVLAFCGNGVYDHSAAPAPAGHHCSLVCSFNRRVSAETVDNIAAEQQFCGTFVRILNTCDADPVGRTQRPMAPMAPMASNAAFRGMVISASSPFTSTGSPLVKALGAILPKAMVTYECVASLLNSGRVGSELVRLGVLDAGADAETVAALDKHLQGCSASVTPDLRGVFGCPALQPRVAPRVFDRTPDDESDVEL